MRTLLSLIADRRGAAGMEYSLIVSLISVTLIAAFDAIGPGLAELWSEAAAHL